MFPLRKKPLVPAATRRRLEIIVADDVEDIRELARRWLEAEGHTVTLAATGREVIQQLQQRSYDVLVTDILMPDLDGWETILAVGRVRPAIRILAISGGGGHMPIDACLRVAQGVGADAILKKPFKRAEFIAAVNQVVARPAG